MISDDNKVEGTCYLYGWNINFKYKGNNFQWAEDNVVYLMTKDDPNIHEEKDPDKPDSIYRFDASGISVQEFKNKLVKLGQLMP